jgi:hypothetical protein
MFVVRFHDGLQYAGLAERGVYNLETRRNPRKEAETEMVSVWVINPSSGTLWALVMKP